jgi:hypothetical protein
MTQGWAAGPDAGKSNRSFLPFPTPPNLPRQIIVAICHLRLNYSMRPFATPCGATGASRLKRFAGLILG